LTIVSFTVLTPYPPLRVTERGTGGELGRFGIDPLAWIDEFEALARGTKQRFDLAEQQNAAGASASTNT